MKNWILCTLIFLTFPFIGSAQTIAEKKAGSSPVESDLTPEMESFLNRVNEEEDAWQKELKSLYEQVMVLYQQGAPLDSYELLLAKINRVRENIHQLEIQWREMATEGHGERYALWHQPDTNIEQLIIDYGSQSYVYLIPPEIATIALSVSSNLPIPRSSWGEMLDIILAENGVGSQQLNPFLRKLYLIHEDKSNLKLITNKRQDLQVLPPEARVGFVLSPEPADLRRVWVFLEKFLNPNRTILEMVGREILILAQVSDVLELLKLYDFVSQNRGDKDYAILNLSRVNADEMAKVLSAIFDQFVDGGGNLDSSSDLGQGNGLKIIPLTAMTQALFLVGTKGEIKKAESIIREVEGHVGEAQEKVVFWYTIKHSNAEELAEVLSRIYYLMVSNPTAFLDRRQERDVSGSANVADVNVAVDNSPAGGFFPPPIPAGYYLDDRFVVNPAPIRGQPPINEGRDNFIVDPKTGSVVMVVEANILPKLKNLIKKLDVPKKMVQIEILLFEKTISKRNDFGLNLLKVGEGASNRSQSGVSFNDRTVTSPLAGVFEFMLSAAKDHGVPAYDLAYRFLLTQDDVQINASPSVLAINQTEALVEIAEEISVSTGVQEIPTQGSVILKDTFARARYGIKIGVTPTIHMREDNDDEYGYTSDYEGEDYITLKTDITFETIQPSITNRDRPNVTTRHIINDVRIPDGQTVILGGLRRKISSDEKERIPFLGEIPGFGKLFSRTGMQDSSTEMFIFLTPKIISDPVEDLDRLRQIEMCRRPGDIPEFLCRLCEARECEKNRLFENTMNILFGRELDRCIDFEGEWDGR